MSSMSFTPRRATASLAVGLLTLAATTGAATTAAATDPATAAAHSAPPSGPPTTHTGSFADGATWTIEVPGHWNGTVLLFSHGLVPPGAPNPAAVATDPVTEGALLEEGYALAGSSFATTGWAVERTRCGTSASSSSSSSRRSASPAAPWRGDRRWVASSVRCWPSATRCASMARCHSAACSAEASAS